jgi:catalase
MLDKAAKIASAWIGAGLLATGSAHAQASPTELVDALNGAFGKHPGVRASHAKGVCVTGHFVPSPNALAVTHGPLWGATSLPLVGRFSVGGGNPKASDKGKTVRGFALSVDEQWHLVGISAPAFMVATPQEFMGFMAARQPDAVTGQPDVERIKAFNAKTPSTRAQIAYLEKAPVPASYAQARYWGVNAFRFTNAQGLQQYGRWRLEPQAGLKGLGTEDVAQLSDDFLESELHHRLAIAPAGFDVMLQLATPQDNVTDPSMPWPSSNPEVKLGEALVTGLTKGCEAMMFNPALLPAVGIGLSDDPILQARAGAYAVSLARRSLSDKQTQ